MRFFFSAFIFFQSCLFASGQEFNYVHYDTKDGLAGTTVYCMGEDKDGFKWFGTENGLSRFDGSRFVNYTVSDGLPDNEVLELLGDHKGRVWISTFSRQLCYYFQGKIYNAKNSPWLQNFKLSGPVTRMAEDSRGNIVFTDNHNLYWLSDKNIVTNSRDSPNFLKYLWRGHFFSDFDRNDNLILSRSDSVFSIKDGVIKPLGRKTLPFAITGQFAVYNGLGSEVIKLPGSDVIQRLTYANQKVSFVASNNGAWEVDTSKYSLNQHFLPGIVVSEIFMGDEKNIWFTTIGNGVYKLPSKETKTLRFGADVAGRRQVFHIMEWNRNLLCGLNFSETRILDSNLKEIGLIDLKQKTVPLTTNASTNRQTCGIAFDNNTAFLGFDAFLVKLTKQKVQPFDFLTAIKSIEKIDSDHILVGNHIGAFKIRVHDMKAVDTVWRQRVTKALYHNGFYYIGTTNGLYKRNANGTIDTLSKLHPALTSRITGLALMNDVLWVGSGDNGVVALKGNKVIAAVSHANGLSSDICRSIYASNNELWVGTNSGLNKIRFSNGLLNIAKFGRYDGLPSDIIDAIMVKDSLVYLGTPEGLTYFNEKKLVTNSLCKLRLLGVRLDNKARLINGTYYLPYRHNTFGIDFTGISFRSAGDIRYFYRVKGLNEKWQITRNQNLEFPALPPGAYELHLQAVNRFGVKSSVLKLNFVVSTPFWQTWWFILIAILFATSVTLYFISRRNENLRHKYEQQLEVEKRLADLEQQALQAQMNPHFIFNCLNSIQQYFLTNDGEKANKFLSMFAALVRETLHFSSQKSIRVSDEVRYLTRYLEMEKMRFGDHFIYEIEVDPELQTNFVEIPALMLQPYVENAIRHGVRHRKNGSGKIKISFVIKGEELYCIVADNGVGREKSKAMRGRQPVEYQSRGMELGQKRIEALNKVFQRAIKVEIKDLKDSQGAALGTEVHLIIPI